MYDPHDKNEPPLPHPPGGAVCRVPVTADSFSLALPAPLADAVAATAADWRAAHKIERLWARDATLWTGRDEARWLDWLTIGGAQSSEAQTLARFARTVRAAGYRNAVLLGMGGSSLAPEVLAATFGAARGYPPLQVLDSTDPAQIAAVMARIEPRRTLFIVSSKSGTTLDTDALQAFCFERARQALGRREAGRRFVAITDPGSALETQARAAGFGRVFLGQPSIGGRFSALSSFGLVPAATLGLDLARLLARAGETAAACRITEDVQRNPGLALGATLGTAAQLGRDKLTLMASPRIVALGAWLEQLIAESTGKDGKGIVPVDREPALPIDAYGDDRLFAYLRFGPAPDPAQDALARDLARAGRPVITLTLRDEYDLGREFFRWEFATAVAGSIIGIHPFDQPDVESSKTETRGIMAAYGQRGARSFPMLSGNHGLEVRADAAELARNAGNASSVRQLLRAHLERVRPGDFVAILAYLPRDAGTAAQLDSLRSLIARQYRVTTCVGFGPRFLHSTGQLYKGGANRGVFLQLTAEPADDLAIPGLNVTFGALEAAQAQGDFAVLAARGRRLLWIHLGTDRAAGLRAVANALAADAA